MGVLIIYIEAQITLFSSSKPFEYCRTFCYCFQKRLLHTLIYTTRSSNNFRIFIFTRNNPPLKKYESVTGCRWMKSDSAQYKTFFDLWSSNTGTCSCMILTTFGNTRLRRFHRSRKLNWDYLCHTRITIIHEPWHSIFMLLHHDTTRF